MYLKIPNIYLKVSFLMSLPIFIALGFGPILNLCWTFGTLLLLMAFKVGMGDIKLIGLIAILRNPVQGFLPFKFCLLLLVCAVIHLIISMCAVKSPHKRIALAPSIFAALALYLATS